MEDFTTKQFKNTKKKNTNLKQKKIKIKTFFHCRKKKRLF